jgi:hypothetical protein
VFSTTVFFTQPGPYYQPAQNGQEHPTEGVDFFAKSPTVASRYDYEGFGHQVIGLYLGPTSPGVYQFGLAIHNTLSDENPDQWIWLPLTFTGTAKHPQIVHIKFKQLAVGNWKLDISTPQQTALVLTSTQYGPTWNTAQGLDAVRYFTSQGGTNPGGPLEWTTMGVK